MESETLFAAILFGAFLILRLAFPTRSEQARGKRERRNGRSSAFHAVCIEPARVCCQEARVLVDQSFLSDDAPTLPLQGCNAEMCGCRYVHSMDRRGGSRDRRQLSPVDIARVWSLRERRETTMGRRQGDLQAA